MRLTLLTILSMVMVNVFAQNPQITVSRNTISTSVANGGTTTQTFTITNTGNRDLNWKLKTRGVPVDFTKPSYANWTEASKQDRITSNVWLTRQNNQGLFNIAVQSSFNSSAPAGTEWSFGKSEDLQPGDYSTWQSAVNGDPQSMIDQVISMHAITDNRYFDITFHSFSGNNTGGGFSYTRVEQNLQWMAANFVAGTLIPGQSKTVTLTFDASEITGGTYNGFAVIESNDPANTEKAIAINLTVADAVGTGEIDAVLTKNFGNGYVNFASEKIITINNIGTGILQISNVVSGNPAFVVEASTFSIAPGQGYDLHVMFMPTAVGTTNGALVLTTNDADEGTFVVSVSGNGVGAPVSAASASSISTSVASGSTSNLPFTLSNNGVSDLAYSVSFNLGKSTPVTFTKTNFADPLLPENQDRLSPNVVLTRSYQQGLFNAAVETGFSSSTSPANTLWSSSSTATSTASSYTNWRDMLDGDPTDMLDRVTSVNLTEEDRYFDVVLKQWTCCQNGGSFTYERTEIYNWVKASVANGTVTPGANTTFDLQFNTIGLPGGTYNGTFTITSNDPAVPVRNIPVSLTVTGTPEARVHEASVAFENTAIGLTSRKKIRVINDGATALNITAVTYSDAEFTTFQATGTIQPFAFGVIEIAFTPSALESYSGNITLTTNDPANPTLTIPYTAAGVAPGEINVVAADMDDAVTTGQTVTKTITIENAGEGELHWSAEMLNNNPVVSFSKANYADYKDAANQDRIAPNVWITRQNERGLFNIAVEDVYERAQSPVGTAWQYGSTFEADLSSYDNWEDAIDSDPLEAVNQIYSIHTANEYYDLTMRNWTSNGNGGGFAYERKKAAGWIKLSTYGGTLLPGESTEITVTYDPSDYITSTKSETLIIKSDDPNESSIQVPIELSITGLPVVVTSTTELNFNNVGLGFNKSLPLKLTNTGTEVLNISSVTSSNPAFIVTQAATAIPVNESVVINVQFTPGAVQSYTGQLQITSDASNESGLTIDLSGAGIQVPDINITPGSIIHRTTSQTVFNGEIKIENTGGADLDWASGRASAYPLAKVLENLNAGFSTITSLIPSKYTFNYDGGSNRINDGGSDMYDGGNYLNTNFSNQIQYSDNVIASGEGLFGTGTQYFTRHLSGLFVTVADLKDVTNFSISGNNGADGSGSVDGAVLSSTLNGTQYTGYLKRVYGTSDPSINQLIIIENDATVTHSFDSNSDNTQQDLSNLTNVKRVYYLLYAGASGGFINDATAKSIMDEFLDVISGGNGFLADWVTLDTYAGTVAPGATQTINYTIDLTSYADANYTTSIPMSSNDPDESLINIPVEINIGSVLVTSEVNDILVNEGFGSKVVDFSNVFTDGNGDALTYAVGSNLEIVTGSIANTNLTLTEAGVGTSIVSIRAEDTHGNVAYEDFNFRVNDVPSVVTPIDDIVVVHGFGATTVEASNVFVDTDESDIVTLTVTSSNPNVAQATLLETGVIKLIEGVVGTSTITLTANDGIGGVASESFTITVEKATATLAVSNTSAVYDGTAKLVTITSTPANLVVAISYSQNGNAVASPVNAGVYNVTATVIDASFAATYNGTLTISKADQVITFNTIANVMNSHAPFTLTATATSGLPVSFAKLSGPITVSGNTVTLTGEVGTASIEATQSGNANYNAATVAVRTFAIDQDPVLSVDDAHQAHLQAYPVPAKQYLYVSTGTYTISRIALIDAFGREVYSAEPNQSTHTINTNEVKQGVYFLQVITQKGLVSRRVEVVK